MGTIIMKCTSCGTVLMQYVPHGTLYHSCCEHVELFRCSGSEGGCHDEGECHDCNECNDDVIAIAPLPYGGLVFWKWK